MEFPKPRVVFQSQTMMETIKKIAKQIEDLQNFEKISLAFSQYDWDAGQIFSMSPGDRFTYIGKIIGKIYDQEQAELYDKTIVYQKMWDKISAKLYDTLEKLFEFKFEGEAFIVANLSPSPIVCYDEKANCFDACYKRDVNTNIFDWIVMFIKILWQKKLAEVLRVLGYARNPQVDAIMERYLIHFAFTTTDISKCVSKPLNVLPDSYEKVIADGIKLYPHLKKQLKSGVFKFIQNAYELIAINLNLFE